MIESERDLLPDIRTVRVLERLRLKPRNSFSGRVRGERLAREKGVSLEFKDYRDYSEGDDLRHVDWNVLARLGVPIVKTYQDEEDLPVMVLVDCSTSMDFGEPNKFLFARQLAAGFGVIAGRGGDSVQGLALGSGGKTRFLRGRRGTTLFSHWLASLKPGGDRPVSFEIRQLLKAVGRVGLFVVVSDGMDPQIGSAIGAIAAAGHEVWFLQTLSPFEIDPAIEGDLRLIDLESGAAVEITANGPTLAAYRSNLEAHNLALQMAVTRYGGRYALLPTDRPLSEVFAETLRSMGWFE